MSLLVSSLNSGSNGNCYYVSNGDEAVLIDCGIHCREIEKRMKRLGLSIRKIKGIFITHEHGDHISGAKSISKKYKIPIYITDKTFEKAGLKMDLTLLRFFRQNETMNVGALEVEAFPKSHDAVEPVCFTVKSATVVVGVFTDLGYASPVINEKFAQCNAAFLEANYDDDMLENGYYPFHLKERIRGNLGHLSNKQALQLITEHKASGFSHLFLSHLSKHNNAPKIVEKLFEPLAAEIEVVIASRKKETRIYHVRGTAAVKKFAALPAEQLSLF